MENTELYSHVNDSPGLVDAAIARRYELWKRYGHHLEEYACEFGGTAFHIFVVVIVVGVMFGKISPIPALIPMIAVRLFIAGILIGCSAWLVAVSPLGRLSGAHINPAISIGFWSMGKMHFKDLVGYIVAQLSGGLIGALIASTAFPILSNSVQDALLVPHAVTTATVLILEVGATFVLGTVVYYFVSSEKLMKYTPQAVTLTAGVLVCIDGALSGACLNPARWFGPAYIEAYWRLGWVYVTGPICGALFAALVHILFINRNKKPCTCKLYHDETYRSIFKHDTVLTTPPSKVLNFSEKSIEK